MLNELHDLAQSLAGLKISLASWHKLLNECPLGGSSYFVYIGPDAQLQSIKPIRDRERLASLRKYEKAAGYSFPSLNAPPLWRPDDESVRDQAIELRKSLASHSPPSAQEIEVKLRALIGKCGNAWIKAEKTERGKDEMDKIGDCLQRITADLKQLVGRPSEEGRAFVELLHRASQLTGASFHQALTDVSIRYLAENPSDAAALDMLIEPATKSVKKASLVLELTDQSQFPRPANHIAVYQWLNRCLMESCAAQSKSAKAHGIDAYGSEAGGLDGSFPEVKMSRLGKVKLRAMSSESPCQQRYGMADAKSYPVSATNRQAMKNALEWISREERRGKTWCDISSTGNSGILFAYPSELPPEPPETSLLFVGNADDPNADVGSFESCAQRVTAALKGQVGSQSTAEIRIFVLTKPDGFRTKVLHSSKYSVEHVLTSAKDWQAGCADLPLILIRQFGKAKGDPVTWEPPSIPFPAEVTWCLNTVWARLGSEASLAHGYRIADALALLLEQGIVLQEAVQMGLRLVYANSTPVLLALAQAHVQGQVLKVPKAFHRQLRLLPSLLGLLLSKSGLDRGTYMSSPPFLVGRLMSLADQLHLLYCEGVRNGQVPPQLLGNALMATALEQPTKALAMLSQRVLPYQAWAKTLQSGERVRLVKYVLGQLGKICDELTESSLPDHCSDADRAVMLLGYLARPTKASESLLEQSETDTELQTV